MKHDDKNKKLKDFIIAFRNHMNAAGYLTQAYEYIELANTLLGMTHQDEHETSCEIVSRPPDTNAVMLRMYYAK